MRLLSIFRRVSRAAVGVVVLATTACAGALGGTTATNDKAAASLVLVQGGDQSGQAGRDLPNPVVLRVLNAAGEGVEGVTVTLSISAGGGAITPPSDTTDAHGEFRAKWTLGPGAVVQSILASAPGVVPITVGAIGLLPTQIVLAQGNNQSAKTGTALTNSIIVRVVGANNTPMQGVTVGFQVLSGGGGMSPATVVTNALGEASTKWTVGTVGAQSASASAGSLPAVSISATATP
jgi:Bacterial Ig-like domain (group 1)